MLQFCGVFLNELEIHKTKKNSLIVIIVEDCGFSRNINCILHYLMFVVIIQFPNDPFKNFSYLLVAYFCFLTFKVTQKGFTKPIL